MNYKLCVPCLFGLEAIVAGELKRMGMPNVVTENGRVEFDGDDAEIARANLWLRSGERVMIEMASFGAATFDELFEGVKAAPWERYISKDGCFPVKGHSLDSKLSSVPACQSIIKKATVERLRAAYGVEVFEESAEKYQIKFIIHKDIARVYLDTSGAGLHKRGYRPESNTAPLRETLAAAIVDLTRFRAGMELTDPFCGSGTLVIEAALKGMNAAPGMYRRFAAERWPFVSKKVWEDERERACSMLRADKFIVYGADIDPACIGICEENARRAHVGALTRFKVADAVARRDYSGIVACNPPYGERMEDAAAAGRIYRDFGRCFTGFGQTNAYILSSHDDFERQFGHTAAKKRKLYNGMIKCSLFMYFET